MSKRLGTRLREERRERGESQRTTAPRFGISQPGYARWESGENNPDDSQYDAVASFLGCDVDEVWAMIHDPDTEGPIGAELGQRVANLEAEANGVRRELAELRQVVDRLIQLQQPPKKPRSR